VIVGRTPYELRQLDLGHGASDDVVFNTVRNVSCRYESDTINGLDLDGFRIWSQGDRDSAQRLHEPLYGWSYEYHNVYSINNDKVHRMAKTLKTIEKRMDKLRDTQGRPKTFGQFVAHVAKAIGATMLVITSESQRGWDWRSVSSRCWKYCWSWISRVPIGVLTN
jgi:hypothetical protein